MKPVAICALAVAVAGCDTVDIPEVNLVPVPQSVEVDEGYFQLRADSRIVVSPGAETVGEFLAVVLRRSTGYDFDVITEDLGSNDILLQLDPGMAAPGDEGYEIAVADNAVVTAPTAAGLFYGCQTLRQLLPPGIERPDRIDGVDWSIPIVRIQDYPRFAWRGSMLDVARHFFDVDDVKRYIDLISYHKLNRLHLHLTDDQGWRIQIDSWPMLTTIGGSTEVGGGPGGYYTKAQFAEIVAYAEARFVTIVPEIDMPGHTNAALASYGELNEDGQPTELYTGTDVGFSSLWVEGAITYTFVDDVIREVAEMTPGPYIHIGGDESDATSQANYVTFIEAVQEIVTSHGKTMIGWEEIGGADVTAPFLAQYWLTEREAREAAQRGGKIIASPAVWAYLDIKYDAYTPIGLSWVGFTDLDKAYAWDPVMSGLSQEDIIGLEAPLWTETVETLDDIELLAFPRLAGHAEIAWSAIEGRSWDEYRVRLAHHGARLDAMGVNYYRSPVVDWR